LAELSAPYDWERLARLSQKMPEGDWRIWLVMAGRGFGKTRMGAEAVRRWVQDGYRRIALIGNTREDVRSVMIEGVSGLLNICPDFERPEFERSKDQLLWPNGAMAQIFSAERYEKLRGPQFDAAWIDELAKFRRVQDVWDQLMLGLRLGEHPKVIITTTPRPIPLLKQLMARKDVLVTRGSSFENAQNLPQDFLATLATQYGHTRLGAQEIYAQILDETPGALWTRDMIKYQAPAGPAESNPFWQRIIIGVDPAVSHTEHSDETGIVVVALGADDCAYVIDDHSLRAPSTQWAKLVIQTYHQWQANVVVAEKNKGGDLVESVLRVLDPNLAYRGVIATKGKVTRAEPIAALYQQGKVFHCQPLEKLERQMTGFVPGPLRSSPDRVDALVWALTELMLKTPPSMPAPRVWLV